MTSINQEMINKANTKCDAYEAPHLTIIPLRTSGMLCLSAGDVYTKNDVEVLDFYREGSESANGIQNGKFTEWTDESGNGSFF